MKTRLIAFAVVSIVAANVVVAHELSETYGGGGTATSNAQAPVSKAPAPLPPVKSPFPPVTAPPQTPH